MTEPTADIQKPSCASGDWLTRLDHQLSEHDSVLARLESSIDAQRAAIAEEDCEALRAVLDQRQVSVDWITKSAPGLNENLARFEAQFGKLAPATAKSIGERILEMSNRLARIAKADESDQAAMAGVLGLLGKQMVETREQHAAARAYTSGGAPEARFSDRRA